MNIIITESMYIRTLNRRPFGLRTCGELLAGRHRYDVGCRPVPEAMT